jgi:WD40 repeat protein
MTHRILSLIVPASLILLCFSVIFPFAASSAQDGGKWQSTLTLKLPAAPRSLAYDGDGKTLAVGHSDGQVSLWDTKTGEQKKPLSTGSDSVEAVFFLPGAKLIAITVKNRAQVWSIADGKQLAKLDNVTPISGVSVDGKWLVTQDPKHVLALWDLTTFKRTKELGKTGLDGAVNVNFTADGRSIAIAFDHRLDLIDVGSRKIAEIPIRGKPQGMKVEATGPNTVVLSLGALDDDSAIIHRVVPGTRGPLLAVGRGWYGKPNFVDLWDYSAARTVRRFKPKDDGQLAQISFDDLYLAIGGARTVTVWSVTSGEQVAELSATEIFEETPLAKGTPLFAFSPAADEIAVVENTNVHISAKS